MTSTAAFARTPLPSAPRGRSLDEHRAAPPSRPPRGAVSDRPMETVTTPEMEYRLYPDRLYKRSLPPDELPVRRGRTYVPPATRLRNEAACLEFVRRWTDVPVPEVLEASEEAGGSFVLVVRPVHGVQMGKLGLEAQAVVAKEVQAHVDTLHALRSDRPGGPSGLCCPPSRAILDAGAAPGALDIDWPARAPGQPLVFCHGNLVQMNVLVDLLTMKVAAIINWQYAGFWPAYYDEPYFRGPLRHAVQYAALPADSVPLTEYLRPARDPAPAAGESSCQMLGPR